MEEWNNVTGRLRKLKVTDSGLVLELKGDFSEELRRKREDSRQSWLDIPDSFVGEEVVIDVRCYHPHLTEKQRRLIEAR